MKLKDKKIELLSVSYTQTENGYAGKEVLTPICPPVWAYFRHLSGDEYFAAGVEQVREEVLFVVNWRAGLDTTHVIRYGGALWDITRVDTFEGYKGDLKVYAKRRK